MCYCLVFVVIGFKSQGVVSKQGKPMHTEQKYTVQHKEIMVVVFYGSFCSGEKKISNIGNRNMQISWYVVL